MPKFAETDGVFGPLFDMVAPRDDWRGPINAVVPYEADVAGICAAVEFYTATKATVKDAKGGFRIVAKGYRAGPAGP